MKWFKHDSDASSDAKVKKLIIRHGALGYAVYFHCLELITSDLSESHLTFELEHDSEIIADNLKIVGNGQDSGMDIVEKIMRTIIELNLFVENESKLFCLKLAKRIDSSMTSNPKFREKIKKSHDRVMIGSCKNRIEENRIEENRKDNTIKEKKKEKYNPKRDLLFFDDPDFKEVWKDYISVRTKKKAVNSDRAIRSIICKLKVYSDNNKQLSIEVLENSINGGWSDIWEPKNKKVETTETFEEKLERVDREIKAGIRTK